MIRRGSKAVVAVAGLTALLGAACNNSNFSSETPKKSAEAKVEKPQKKSSDASLKMICEGGKGEARLVTELKGTEESTVRLEGEFCGIPGGEAAGKLTVLFLLDFSGSMRDNDPLVGTSCGRLQAGQAIVDKLEADLEDGVELAIGINGFATRSIPVTTPLTLEEFKAQLTPEVFCRENGGGTNYEAAFASATETLQAVEGAKAIYFISDGLPTQMGTLLVTNITDVLGGQRIYEAGRTAAATLRAIPDLTMNALFMTNVGQTEEGALDPQTYLEEITGDKDRVKLVANAEDLAAEIVKLDTPDAVSLDKDSVTGVVTAASLGKTDIELASLEQDPTREGVWVFETKPFKLFAKPSKAVENEVTFTVKGGDGKDYKATALITFEVSED